MKKNPLLCIGILLSCIFLLCFQGCFSQKKEKKEDIVEQPSNKEHDMAPGTTTEQDDTDMIPETDISTTSNSEPTSEHTETKQETSFTLQEVERTEVSSNYSLGSQQHQTLLPALQQSVVIPQDYTIGTLIDIREYSREQKEIINTLNTFFTSLKGKTVETTLINGGKDSELFMIISHHVNLGYIPVRIRYGNVTVESDHIACVRVKFFGKKGSTEGDIYLIKDNIWYISDMQIDFYDFEEPAESGSGRYRPIMYNEVGEL
jgi:hypothetical protein